MTPEQVEQILDMLVEKLGPIGEHVWSVFVRQVYVEAIFGGVMGMLFLLMALGFLVGGIWSAKAFLRVKAAEQSSYPYSVGDRQVVGILVCAIGGPTMLILGMAALSTLVHLFNVEYYAIQMLLGR